MRELGFLIIAGLIAIACDEGGTSGRPDGSVAPDASAVDAPPPPDGAPPPPPDAEPPVDGDEPPPPDAEPLPPDAEPPPPDAAAACPIPGCGPETVTQPEWLDGVWVGGDTVWAFGDDTIGRRFLGSGTWCWCRPAPGAELRAIWGIDDDDLWLVGARGAVLRWDGTGFATLDAGTTADLSDVWASGPGNVIVVGDGGIVRRFDGTSWSATDLGPDKTWDAVWGASASDIWIGGSEPAPYPGNPNFDGESAILYRWQPGTGTWAEEGKFTMYYGAAGIYHIHGTGADDVWAEGDLHPAGAAGATGSLFHRDGATWSQVSAPDTSVGQEWFSDIAAVGDEVWATGGLDTRYFDGASWSLRGGTGADLTAIDGRPGEVWAVGGPSKIVRWNGTQWVRDP